MLLLGEYWAQNIEKDESEPVPCALRSKRMLWLNVFGYIGTAASTGCKILLWYWNQMLHWKYSNANNNNSIETATMAIATADTDNKHDVCVVNGAPPNTMYWFRVAV